MGRLGLVWRRVPGVLKSFGRDLISFSPFVLLLPLFLCVVSPLEVALTNSLDVRQIPGRGWLGLVALATGLMIFLAAIQAFTREHRSERPFLLALRFAFLYVVITALTIPLTGHTGLTSQADVAVRWGALPFAIGLAGGLTALTLTRLRPRLRSMLATYLVLNLAVLLFGRARLALRSVDVALASPDRNLFVLSFDGLPRAAVLAVLSEDAVLADQLSDFIVFDHVASSSPATSASIVAELYGNHDFKTSYATIDAVWDSDPTRLTTNHLATSGWDVFTYGMYSRDRTAPSVLPVSTFRGDLAYRLLTAGASRSFGPGFALPDRLAASTMSFLDSSTPETDPGDRAYLRSVTGSNAPTWSGDLAVSELDFRHYLTGLSVGASHPTAQFLHFTQTHYPITLDQDCNYRADDAHWYSASQNWSGVVDETRCAVSQFVDFLQRLRALGIYDQSLIVLKSDHGKPVPYGAPGSLDAEEINGNALWGYGRYAPFLAIKPDHWHATSYQLDHAPAMLDDLARTECVWALGASGCDAPGFDLLDPDATIPPTAEVTVFVVSSPASDYRYETQEAITVLRGDGVVESLHDALRGG